MLNLNSFPVSDLIQQQVPSFVRENHEKFVEFLSNYYEYLDQNENINDYIRNIISYLDVDQTTEYLLNDFFEELRTLPRILAVDKRLLVKHIHDLYDSKGSPNSFELLFRILFDESITIDYPSDNILRASDGVWRQDVFVTIEAIDGTLPIDGTVFRLTFENQYGKFNLTPSQIVPDELNPDMSIKTYRVYFDSKVRLKVDSSQIFYTYNIQSVRTFVGRLLQSPARIEIIDGGKYWQVGSIFTIPGTRLDTLCRVTKITTGGKIKQIEVIQHGMGHTVNQTLVISPFPNKPSGTAVYFDKTLVSYNPTVFDHQLTITDDTNGIEESLVGFASVHDTQSYFGEDYVDPTYTGRIVFAKQETFGIVSQSLIEDVSIQEWIDSRAMFVVVFDSITKTRGEFLSERGKISNPLIRLQDNNFYQLYSYVIRTGHDIAEYRNAMSIVHPAGTKFFAELQKSFDYDLTPDISVTRTMSVDKMLLFDTFATEDTLLTKHVQKELSESQTSIDFVSRGVSKYHSDTVESTMSDSTTVDRVLYNGEDYFDAAFVLREIITTIT
jgi:hypothetical protein